MDREKLLVELYTKCIKHNYTDINDETQKLKIKVFAMDLGLKYKKIEDLYSEARAAYIQHQKDMEIHAQRLAAEALEKARRIEKEKSARLAFTIESPKSYTSIVKVFRCSDGTVFCKMNNDSTPKYNFSIGVESGSIAKYNYHPSKKYFTGAAAGGIMLGGFHETEAHYTTKRMKTNKGSVIFSCDSSRVEIESVTIEPEIGKLFRRIESYNSLFCDNKAICKNNIRNSPLMAAAINTADFSKQMELTGLALDEAKISYTDCVNIANILNSIIKNDLPMQDEEIYQNAIKLSAIKELKYQAEAIKQFTYIKDYKDSELRTYEIRPIYEELLQKSKEQLVLQKEADAKKKRIRIITASVLLFVFIIGGMLTAYFLNMNNKYTAAKSYLDNKQYDNAISAFTSLGYYKDSDELLKESKYQYALEFLDTNQNSGFSQAIEKLKDIEDYKDSKDKILLAQALSALSAPSQYQSDPQHAFYTAFCDHMHSNFTNAKSIIESHTGPLPDDLRILYDQINFALSYYGTWDISSGSKAILFMNTDKYQYVDDISTEKIHIALLFNESGIGIYFLPVAKSDPEKVFSNGCMFSLSDGLFSCQNNINTLCQLSDIINNEISVNEYSGNTVSRTLKLIKTANTFQ